MLDAFIHHIKANNDNIKIVKNYYSISITEGCNFAETFANVSDLLSIAGLKNAFNISTLYLLYIYVLRECSVIFKEL